MFENQLLPVELLHGDVSGMGVVSTFSSFMLAYFLIVEKNVEFCLHTLVKPFNKALTDSLGQRLDDGSQQGFHQHCGQNDGCQCLLSGKTVSWVEITAVRSLHRRLSGCFHRSTWNFLTRSKIPVAFAVPNRSLGNQIPPPPPPVSIVVHILETLELITLGDSCYPIGMWDHKKWLI